MHKVSSNESYSKCVSLKYVKVEIGQIHRYKPQYLMNEIQRNLFIKSLMVFRQPSYCLGSLQIPSTKNGICWSWTISSTVLMEMLNFVVTSISLDCSVNIRKQLICYNFVRLIRCLLLIVTKISCPPRHRALQYTRVTMHC